MLALVGAFILAQTATKTPGILLRRQFKSGETILTHFTSSETMNVPRQTVVNSYDLLQKVSACDKNGRATIHGSIPKSQQQIDGQVFDEVPQLAPELVIDDRNQLISVGVLNQFQAGAVRHYREENPVFDESPVSVGETWKVHFDKDTDADYHLTKLSDDGKVAWITWTFREVGTNQAAASGDAQIYVDSGEIKTAHVVISYLQPGLKSALRQIDEVINPLN